MFDVSRMTARKALDQLVTRGYLYKIKGKGTFVVDRLNRNVVYLDEIIGFTERVRRSGRTPKTEVIDFERRIPVEHVRSRLKMAKGEEIYYIRRVRYIDNEPVIMEITYMPVGVSPDLTKEAVEVSKYAYLRETGHWIETMVKEYIPVMPGPDIREILGVDKQMAMFKTELVAMLDTGAIFEYTKIYYNQNKYRFLQVTKNTKPIAKL
jgi:DNA-binding GntR family transcriptional regulator